MRLKCFVEQQFLYFCKSNFYSLNNVKEDTCLKVIKL